MDQAGGRGDILIAGERRGSVAVLHVSDTGPGIPEVVRERVFTAFQSAAKSGGTGLGLAISAELAEAHGGSLKVARTGPRGTPSRSPCLIRRCSSPAARRARTTAFRL